MSDTLTAHDDITDAEIVAEALAEANANAEKAIALIRSGDYLEAQHLLTDARMAKSRAELYSH